MHAPSKPPEQLAVGLMGYWKGGAFAELNVLAPPNNHRGEGGVSALLCFS
jgi:hypothetical protein